MRLAIQRLLCEPWGREAAAKGLAWGGEMVFAVDLAGRLMACCWAWAWPQRRRVCVRGLMTCLEEQMVLIQQEPE